MKLMRNYKILIFCLIINVLTIYPVQGQSSKYADIFKEVKRAVVKIDYEDGAREVGSGIVIGITTQNELTILTAHHVVQGYSQVIVTFSQVIDKQYTGLVSPKFVSVEDDIAIIIVQDTPLKQIEMIGFSEDIPDTGEPVGTIGHPDNKEFSWTDGSINKIFGKLVFHDAKIRIGSSGGPLLDEYGRMIGINLKLRKRKVVPIQYFRPNIKTKKDTTLEIGSSVTMNSASVLSILNGWFKEDFFKEKWEIREYATFWHRFCEDPWFIGGEIAIVGGIIYCILECGPDPNGDKEFGKPPDPPTGE